MVPLFCLTIWMNGWSAVETDALRPEMKIPATAATARKQKLQRRGTPLLNPSPAQLMISQFFRRCMRPGRGGAKTGLALYTANDDV